MKRMMKLGMAAVAVGALMIGPGTAQGTIVGTADLNFAGVGPGFGVTVVLDGVFSGGTQAGVFNWTQAAFPGQDLDAFCIDLYQTVASPNPVTYAIQDDLTLAPVTTTGLIGMAQFRADAIAETWAEIISIPGRDLDPGNDPFSLTAFEAAAIQLAIWEYVFENALASQPDGSITGTDLQSGNFRVTSVSAGSVIDVEAEAIFASVNDDAANSTLATLNALTAFNSQDQTYLSGSDIEIVPLPAAFYAGLPILLGAIALRRRILR
jgi:hypothetical protein